MICPHNRCFVFIVIAALGFLQFDCSKKKDIIPGPSATAPVAETKTVSPVDTLAALSRPTTRPGIIQSGDWLRVSVDDLLAQNKTAVVISRVNADGTADFPMVGFIAVSGLNDIEAQRLASAAYKKAMIIPDANVIVQRIYLGRPGDPAPGPIHPFDLVRIDVMDLQSAGLTSTSITRVTSDGRIGPPSLKPVKIADLTNSAAAALISKAYKDAQMVPNAYVRVMLLEAAPPNAEHLDLPDGPVYPVPDALRALFIQ